MPCARSTRTGLSKPRAYAHQSRYGARTGLGRTVLHSPRTAAPQAVPAAAHPRRAATTREGLGGGGAGQVTKRGLYKRLQVQSFAAALRALQLPRGSTVLDCGSGQGNLALPLAAAAPELQFVGVEIEAELVGLLEERAAAARLSNVRGVAARIGVITRNTPRVM